MNLRNLILSAAAVALVGLTASGCNENPTEPSVDTPRNLAASSLSSTSVAITWDAVAGATSYKLMWAPVGSTTATAGEVTATTNTGVATNLLAGTRYRFTVTATTVDGTSPVSAALEWAGASRHDAEINTGGTKRIRMYEFASSSGSGLLINGGGPKNASLAAGRPDRAQLAMYLTPRTDSPVDTLIIGPVFAIPEYRISGNLDPTRVDTSVYISSSSFAATSMDLWYLDDPLNTYIAQADGNVRAFAIPAAQISASRGFGFIVRFGPATATPQHNYARIFVKAGANGLVQGSFPNRYVELEISYQDTPNLPFAKPVGARQSPVAFHSVILP